MERRVILFRDRKQPEDSYEKALVKASFAPQFVPVLKFEFTNTSDLKYSLLDSSSYWGLVITSQTAVDAILNAVGEETEQLKQQWKEKPVFVVGRSTEVAVQALGLKTSGADSGNANALNHSDHPCPDCALLFPCGNMRKDTLPTKMSEAKITLACQVCYNTSPHPQTVTSILQLHKQMPLSENTSLVFFSPSGVQYVLPILRSHGLKNNLTFASIGPSTTETLKRGGVDRVLEASKPSSEALVNVL